MTASYDKLLEKWAPILEQHNQSQKWDPISSSYHGGIDPVNGSEFPPLLPIAMKIGGCRNSPKELEKIKGEVAQENRDRAIDSVLENKEFNPTTIEEHPDYKEGYGTIAQDLVSIQPLSTCIGMPKMDLLYLDYQYGGTSSNDI